MGSRLVADGLHARTRDNDVETKYSQLFTKLLKKKKKCWISEIMSVLQKKLRTSGFCDTH